MKEDKLKSSGYTEGKFIDSDTGWVRDTTPQQFATVLLTFEDGLDAKKGEYGYFISGLIGIWSKEDLDTLWESVQNEFDFSEAPKEGCITLFLEEDGEWDGFPQWHKYFTIKHMTVE